MAVLASSCSRADIGLFASMAVVTGLLAFGLSTAPLVAILTRHFPNARFH